MKKKMKVKSSVAAKLLVTFDSRERKKSRYLSYPYINLELEHITSPDKTEDSQTHGHSNKVEASSAAINHLNGKPSTAKSGRKRIRGNWCRKFIEWNTLFRGPEFTKASTVELLSGLYSKAIGFDLPNEKNRQSDLVEWFFCSYRLSTFHDEAELAASLINLNGGNSGASVRNTSPDVSTKQEKTKKKKPENTSRLRTKSLSSQADMNVSTTATTSEFLSQCSTEINTAKPVGNTEEVTPLLSSVPEGAAEPKQRKKVVAPDNPSSETFLSSPDIGEKSNICSSLVIDLQMLSPSTKDIPGKNTDTTKEELGLIGSNPESCASEPCSVGNIAHQSLFVSMSTTSEVSVASVKKTIRRRRKRKEKGPVVIKTLIPDLNGSSAENNQEEPKSKLSRNIFTGTGLTQTKNYNRMEANGDAQGTCLLLQFDPGVSLPSKEDLLSTFCRFGPLKVPETQMSQDGHARIVFTRSEDAGEAFCSIQQNKPFGTILLDCKLHHNFSAFSASTSPTLEQCVMTEGPSWAKPLHCERPSLAFIRQNLQMMASTLETSGDTISPDVRNNLEGEITNLLKKVNSMVGF
ncbi:serine/threonine-protein kinase ATM isoform X2 [Senna tora]|uniref:Serine/threonine-protein kinase ATM isoform X2 n=1 Tax=Senna tora TaxID=362788 RepID=A0A834TR73_9FABA|nr:serine/threonine-protein kinase ATM isoform X2 [Senna tora]